MARIAITGGTGFVGIHTTKALVRAGHEVVVVSRGQHRGPRVEGSTPVKGDVVTGRGLAEAFAGCDAVVHLVAIIRERRGATFAAVNAEGARNAVEAAGRAGVGHFVHISAIGVHPNPRYPYLETKWQGEHSVRGSGVPHTVLRPSLIYGLGDGFFTVLTRLIRLQPVVPVVGDGRALFQPIAVEDVARIIVESIERGPDDQIHEIGGPDHLTYEQIIEIIRRELGVRRLLVHVPVRAMLPLAAVMDALLPNPPVTPAQLRLLEKHNITRLDAVPRAFGFRPLAFAENAGYLQNY